MLCPAICDWDLDDDAPRPNLKSSDQGCGAYSYTDALAAKNVERRVARKRRWGHYRHTSVQSSQSQRKQRRLRRAEHQTGSTLNG